MKIDARDILAKDLFKQKFNIPRFQRKYSWGNEELSKFWEDIINNQDSESDDKEYFIGSVIVYPQNGRYSIIDGQQRITTLTIFFSAIRDVLFSIEDEKSSSLAKALHKNVIEDAENIDGQKEFILNNDVMSQETWEKFMKLVLDENSRLEIKPRKSEFGKDEELRNIINAYNFFIRELRSLLPESTGADDKISALVEARDKVLNVKLIEISLENFSKAYTIFNTLNSRGKNLSDADLIKSMFTENINSNSQNDTTLFTWREIEENLAEAKRGNGRATQQLFFYDSFISQGISIRKKTEVYPAYTENTSKENAQERLNILHKDSRYYKNIFSTESPISQYGFDEINASLEALRIFGIIQPSSFLLALIRKNQSTPSEGNKLSTKNLRNAVKTLENFHFIYNAVASLPGNRLNNIYPSFAKRIHQETDSAKHLQIIQELKSILQPKLPSQDEFVAKFSDINYNTGNSKDRALVQYILKKIHIDGYKFGISGHSWNDMSVEHILSEAESLSTGIPASIYGQIGNLIYVNKKINERDLKNLGFLDKKNIMIEKKIEIPNGILEADTWDTDIIKSRTQEVAKIAYDTVWKFDI